MGDSGFLLLLVDWFDWFEPEIDDDAQTFPTPPTLPLYLGLNMIGIFPSLSLPILLLWWLVVVGNRSGIRMVKIRCSDWVASGSNCDPNCNNWCNNSPISNCSNLRGICLTMSLRISRLGQIALWSAVISDGGELCGGQSSRWLKPCCTHSSVFATNLNLTCGIDKISLAISR